MKQKLLCIGIIIAGFAGLSCSENDLSAESYEPESRQAGSLLIIGGGSRPDVMLNQIIDETDLENEENYAIVLTMSGFNPDTSGYYGERQFRELGVENIRSYDFERRNAFTEQAADSLENAALIYITGGSQSRFMEAVGDVPEIAGSIENAYQNGAMIAGTSAGAAIMSRIMITGDQANYPEYTSTFYHLEKDNMITAEGLGLIEGVIVDQHFVERARNNRLLTAVMEYPDHVGIGISESTAILVKGNEAEVVGNSQVLVYRNLSGDSITENSKLGARNIRLDIYLPGESFTVH